MSINKKKLVKAKLNYYSKTFKYLNIIKYILENIKLSKKNRILASFFFNLDICHIN